MMAKELNHRSDESSKLYETTRRGYLKLTGAAAASATALGAASGTAGAESYETITVGSGDTYVHHVNSGETFQNKLIDITASNAEVEITGSGSDWVIRDIGIKGKCTSDDKDQMITAEVDSGSTGLIENVYLGDGAVDGYQGGMFVSLEHAGTLTIRNCNVQEWPDNGIYASAPGRDTDRNDAGLGEVHIENCYAKNNNTDCYRLGTDGSYVRDSVAHVNGDVPDKGGAENARGVWVKEGGTVDIENCDLLLEDPDASYCVWEGDNDETGLARVSNSEVVARDGADGKYRGNVDTSNIGSNPDVSVPNGVPTSAADAADGPDGTGYPHELIVDGSLNDTDASYDFSVTGSVTTMDDPQGDDASGSTASGRVSSYKDGYEFSGDVSTLNVDVGGGYISANVDRANREITITSGSNADYTNYEIAVTGDLTGKSSSDSGDEINATGDGVSGGVGGGGSDAFGYTGELKSINLDDSTCIIDVTRSYVLTIDDVDDDGNTASYNFTVSGSLEKSDAYDATIDTGDSISGSSASGKVTNGRDSYRFTGEITDFSVDAPINPLIDGDEVFTASLGHNVINMNGTGDAQEYQFSVVGGAGAYDGTSGSDTVSDRTISGTVWDGSTDSYDYRNGVFVAGFTDGGTNPTYSDR
jgi:hypothetical protein